MQSANKPCTFGAKCKSKIQGQPCPPWHSKCKFGANCRIRATCPLQHDDGNIVKPSHNKPINEVECKFGDDCNKNARGQCPFKHSKGGASVSPAKSGVSSQGLSEILCKWGDRCNLYQLGKCRFKHVRPQSVIAPPAQPQFQAPQDKHKQVLSQFCLDYLSGKSTTSNGRQAEFTTQKTIRRVFQQHSTQQSPSIRQCMVLPCTSQEQPIFMTLVNGSVSFNQLANLARESGNQHINSSTMLLKRCHNAEICSSTPISKTIILQSLSSQYQPITILLLQQQQSLSLLLLNVGNIQPLSSTSNLSSAAIIGKHLIITHVDKPIMVFSYDPASQVFTPNHSWAPPGTVVKVQSYSRTLLGSEIAVAIMQNNSVCLINSSLETQIIPLEHSVLGTTIVQQDKTPLLLALTSHSLLAINLLTFHPTTILTATLAPPLSFSSLALTHSHLFLGVNQWGILIYNVEQLECPSGVLVVGDKQWQMRSDSRGNVCVVGQGREGSYCGIYKVKKY